MTDFSAHTNEAIAILAEKVLSPMHKAIWDVATELASEWEASPTEVAVWLAEQLVPAAGIMRDWIAGEAEAAGMPIGTLATLVGTANTSNYRRKARLSRQFAEARKAATLSNAPVRVEDPDSPWSVILAPVQTTL